MATKIKPPPKGMKVRTRKPATASPVALVPSQGGAPPGAPAQMPIRVAQGALGHICSLANGRLAAQSPRLYRYGGILVHIERLPDRLETKRGGLIPKNTVTLERCDRIWLQLELTRLAEWQRPIMQLGILQGWCECDAPMKIAEAILSDRVGWKVPVLNGVSEIPVIRDDGSIWAQQGYDEATGIYYDPNGWVFPATPPAPTYNQAQTAIGYLCEPLQDFPFVDAMHHSAALAMILTAMIRRQLSTAPAFGVSAREAGTGKGLLVDVAAIIATGRRAPITPFTKDEDEQRKRITAALMAGHAMINIDNVDGPLDSAALNALLTSESWTERVLGKSEDATVPSNAMVITTGNNLRLEGDMTRRVVPILLDAQMEQPELRRFDRELRSWVNHNRERMVAAALVILAAWRTAGRPVSKEYVPLGSFEQWSLEVAEVLVWLGLPDPCLALRHSGDLDPKRSLLRRALTAWDDLFGESEITVGAMVLAVKDDDRDSAAEVRELLDEVAVRAVTDQARKQQMGYWLRKMAGRVVLVEDGRSMRFVQAGTAHKVASWKAEEVEFQPDDPVV